MVAQAWFAVLYVVVAAPELFSSTCSYKFARGTTITNVSMASARTLLQRIQESGNPAVDDLRERVAELAGINLVDFLEEGKGGGNGGQAQAGKGKGKVGSSGILRL